MKRIAILQPNYIPWKGYIDMINAVDEFIIYDDVQYTRRDWRNRNRVKTAQKTVWLTIPIDVKGKYHQLICDAKTKHHDWLDAHLATLKQAYAKAPFFDDVWPRLNRAYEDIRGNDSLLDIDIHFLKFICAVFGVSTSITKSSDYTATGVKQDRLISLCKQANATHYLSGPAAKDYIDPQGFADADIQLEYADYSGYPEYTQLYGPFDHYVSVLDLLFMLGDDARNYMLSDKRPMGVPVEDLS